MAYNKETVIGVFMDDSYAQRAVQSLQSQGFKARIGDESSLNSLSDLAKEEAQMYTGRLNEGNSIVIVNNAGNRGEDALNIMLDSGAVFMKLHGRGTSQSRSQNDQHVGANYYNNHKSKRRQYRHYVMGGHRARQH